MPTDVDYRYAAKIAARAAGAPVVEMPAAFVSTSPQGSEVDARYQQKLAARLKPVAPVAEVAAAQPVSVSEAPPADEPRDKTDNQKKR